MMKFCAALHRSSSKTRFSTLGIAILLGSLGCVPSADARHRHVHHLSHAARHMSHNRPGTRAVLGSETPANIAAIVIDANSGHVLYARNEHDLRHPASITKVMTLYLLFEQLEQGRLRLDSTIHVSSHAAAQKPTKLGLHAGSSISVEDAIRAVVTRSANDMAVAIAETIGGDEDTFAGMMTRKAHALGMSRTHFENASGLPNDAQVTTAHDLAILGRAIQDRFPRYYPFFSTHVFHYAGQAIRNHNHLLDQVEGMDGIKTGYTRASGYNLLTSVKRNGHSIVAAVLGGASAGTRDRIMARLIENHIENGATMRSVGLLTEATANDRLARSGEELPPELRRVSMPMPPRTALLGDAKGASAGKPDPVSAPIRLASMSNELPIDKPRPAFVAGTPSQPEHNQDAVKTGDGSTVHAATQANMGKSPVTPAGNRTQLARAELTQIVKAEVNKVDAAKAETGKNEAASTLAHSGVAPHGWVIQIGATDDMDKATALLSRAKTEGSKALANAQPYTEKVRKGSETLYRARFAGLAADSAEAACKTLKRSGFSCFATKN